MKHFIVEIIYTKPFETVEPIVPDHRAYLQTGYEKGILLMSGPQVPRVGGILVARADSANEVLAFCTGDPYALAGVATHRVIEFTPKSFQSFLAPWVAEKISS